MRQLYPTGKQAKRLAKVGTVLTISLLSLGSASAQPVSASPQFVAKAQALRPQPLAPRVTSPVIVQEVVVESDQAEAEPVAEPVATKSVQKTVKKSSGGGGDILARIRGCESGGRYNAVSGSGKYRGAYQFDHRTWAGVGGSGDPAAASAAEQDARASALYARRGGSPWPVCSRQ